MSLIVQRFPQTRHVVYPGALVDNPASLPIRTEANAPIRSEDNQSISMEAFLLGGVPLLTAQRPSRMLHFIYPRTFTDNAIALPFLTETGLNILTETPQNILMELSPADGSPVLTAHRFKRTLHVDYPRTFVTTPASLPIRMETNDPIRDENNESINQETREVGGTPLATARPTGTNTFRVKGLRGT